MGAKDYVRRCSLDYCKVPLSTLTEISTGLCDPHQKELESNKHYVGVCWVCNRITLIDEIPHKLKRVFKDKYLFTKGCTHCTPDGEDNAWITFSRFEPSGQLVVTPEGRLLTVSRNKGPNAETELPETDTSDSPLSTQ